MKERKMRSKSDDDSAQSTKKRKKPTTSLMSSRPLRRARTKIKKPKFLSLSNTQLQMLSKTPNNSNNNSSRKKQLDLFPVHQGTEKECPDADPDPPENMADHMFSEEGSGPTTLTGLLNGVVSSTTSSELSHVVACGAQGSVNSARSLVQTAMRRSGEREGSDEERWVSISDVVERRSSSEVAEEEVTSGGRELWFRLKLDYEQVLNAWSGSGKGPFYAKPEGADDVEEELPQTVPDLQFEQYGVVPFWCVPTKGHWSVPEKSFNGQNSNRSQTGGSTGEEGWKIGLREASVLRYKEKRQSRLFAKRIRYEVRKLNAEKRPRIKGRFVKSGAE